MTNAPPTDDQANVQQVIESMEGGTAIAQQINHIKNIYEDMPEEVRQRTMIQEFRTQLDQIEKQLARHAQQQGKTHWRAALDENLEKFLVWTMAFLFIVGLFWSIFFVLGIVALALPLGFAYRRYRAWQEGLEELQRQFEQSKQEIQQIYDKMSGAEPNLKEDTR